MHCQSSCSSTHLIKLKTSKKTKDYTFASFIRRQSIRWLRSLDPLSGVVLYQQITSSERSRSSIHGPQMQKPQHSRTLTTSSINPPNQNPASINPNKENPLEHLIQQLIIITKNPRRGELEELWTVLRRWEVGFWNLEPLLWWCRSKRSREDWNRMESKGNQEQTTLGAGSRRNQGL